MITCGVGQQMVAIHYVTYLDTVLLLDTMHVNFGYSSDDAAVFMWISNPI